MTKAIEYTDEMLEWVEANQADISRVELVKRFNERFNMNTTRSTIPALCKRKGWTNNRDGRFTKNSEPWNKGVKGYMGANKTSFKKGQRVHNFRPVGSERITKDGYIEIKTANPATWRLKHVVVYEQHNGAVPDNHCIRLIDGVKTNCEPSNLMCIPRGANAVINHCNPANTSNTELNRAIILTEVLSHRAREVANG